MSRIHEALKRAQQERASAQPGTPVSAVEIPAPPSPPMVEEPAVTSPAPPAGAVSVEDLLARCPLRPWKPRHDRMLFFNGRKHNLGMEEFRTLRSRLYQIRERQPVQTLLVTSALPGEGKTFTSANLAQAIVRQHERRALLIDADLRRPQLHIELGAPLSPGLSEYLLGETDEFGAIQRSPMSNLFFLPRGKEVPNPSELISNGRLKHLLDRVSHAFDWIIVDSPAAVAISDAAVLAGICDALLLVVQAASTPFDVAQKISREFGDKPIVGVVLNRVEPRQGYSSYYKYYAEEKPKS